MFTGIITAIGTIQDIRVIGQGAHADRVFVIQSPYDVETIDIGASIAHSGVCLTVMHKDAAAQIYEVQMSQETLSKTNLGQCEIGGGLNLERSLRMGDELGGHIVSGHVDGLATIASIEKDGESWRLKIKPEQSLIKFIAGKGSICLDGISLTVNEVTDTDFGVNIIPHTWQVTTLSQRKVGDNLNIEVDLLARYAARILGKV